MTDTAPFEDAMREAIALARKGRFLTAPNPSVGAVLVKNGRVVAGGRHECCGEAHAEVAAIADAVSKGTDPASCTLVVTLEPCNHYGRTPPCSQAILDAGIREVVIGAMDPTAKAGGGAARLEAEGVTVVRGVLKCECEDIIADFIQWETTDLPYTILKLASTLDGRIATRTGHSRWISGEKTRQLVHDIRRHVGAVLVGGNTFYQDNPRLTSRPGEGETSVEKQPLAVVVTSRLPSPEQPFHPLQERPNETIFWTTVAAAASPKAEALRKKGVTVLGLPSLSHADAASSSSMRAELDLTDGLTSLRQDHGCLYVLCEGGGRLGLTLLSKNLAGELYLHLAPRILADNEATPLFNGLSPMQIDEGIPLRLMGTTVCGEDLIVYLRPGEFPECVGSMQKE
jgi:diaminohydroxyphosphoribosylaminopyrimidine deaminase/5-amino-6-(5-phosphoribosylamino)uracil reductase